jgi:hypothetical protein
VDWGGTALTTLRAAIASIQAQGMADQDPDLDPGRYQQEQEQEQEQDQVSRAPSKTNRLKCPIPSLTHPLQRELDLEGKLIVHNCFLEYKV